MAEAYDDGGGELGGHAVEQLTLAGVELCLDVLGWESPADEVVSIHGQVYPDARRDCKWLTSAMAGRMRRRATIGSHGPLASAKTVLRAMSNGRASRRHADGVDSFGVKEGCTSRPRASTISAVSA